MLVNQQDESVLLQIFTLYNFYVGLNNQFSWPLLVAKICCTFILIQSIWRLILVQSIREITFGSKCGKILARWSAGSSLFSLTLRDEPSRTYANDDWCGLYFPVFYGVMAIPHIVDVTSGTKILLISFHFALLDHECSRTHANDDQWGLYFPWFYAVAAIRHIVDVTSGTEILLVSFHFALLDECSRTHANDDWCSLYFPWFYAFQTWACNSSFVLSFLILLY